MELSMAALVAAGSAAMSAIVWLVRLEGRMTTHEAICGERYRHLEERYAEGLDKMKSIDQKIDLLMQRT